MSKSLQKKPSNNISAKITQVFHNKSNMNSFNFHEQKEHLLFKVKPQKSKSELLVTYDDLRKFFPFTLLQFYQNKIKISQSNNKTQMKSISQIQINNNNNNNNNKNDKIIKLSNTQKKQINKMKQSIGQDHNQYKKYEQMQTIFDYDKLIVGKAIFQCVFPSKQRPQNPYIKELNHYQSYKLGGLHGSDDEEEQRRIQNKRKKGKY